jgi:hypothetical protein
LLLQQGALLRCNLRVVRLGTQVVRMHTQLPERRHGLLSLLESSTWQWAIPVPATSAAWCACG